MERSRSIKSRHIIGTQPSEAIVKYEVFQRRFILLMGIYRKDKCPYPMLNM